MGGDLATKCLQFISWFTAVNSQITDISWQDLHPSCIYHLYSDTAPYGTVDGGIDASDLASTVDVSGTANDLFHTIQAVCDDMTIEAVTVGTFEFSLTVDE